MQKYGAARRATDDKVRGRKKGVIFMSHDYSKNTDYAFRRKQWLREGISLFFVLTLRTFAYIAYSASLCVQSYRKPQDLREKLYWTQHCVTFVLYFLSETIFSMINV